MLREQGDLARAVDLLAQGLAIFREEQNPDGNAASLIRLQEVAHDREDHEEADRLFSEAVNWARKVADPHRCTLALSILAHMSWVQGDFDRTAALYSEILDQYRQVADSETIAGTNCALGDLARLRGDNDTAEEFYRRSLALFTAIGHGQGIASLKHNLGHVALRRGEIRQAADLLRRRCKRSAKWNTASARLIRWRGWRGLRRRRAIPSERRGFSARPRPCIERAGVPMFIT